MEEQTIDKPESSEVGDEQSEDSSELSEKDSGQNEAASEQPEAENPLPEGVCEKGEPFLQKDKYFAENAVFQESKARKRYAVNAAVFCMKDRSFALNAVIRSVPMQKVVRLKRKQFLLPWQ